jgi:SWI/SNF-related matrix-associated actin-dependent regulator of chromatin subfamily A member 5
MSPQKRAIAQEERARLRLLRKSRKEELMRVQEEMNREAAAEEGRRGAIRMKYLLAQADIFQHFMPEKKGSGLGSKRGSRRDLAKGDTRHGRRSEQAEDAELLADEMEDGGGAGGVAAAHPLQVQPPCVTGKMREYQLQGLNWMIHLFDNGINGILADEMGLGKTLQTISLLGYLHEFRGITGPHLVIVPKSCLGNWMNEIRRWCPMLRPEKFHGNKEEREFQKEETILPGKFDVCVTSYEMVIKEKAHLKQFAWRYIVIDEAHRIKNENSLLSRVVRVLRANNRMLITGTPLQNNLHELWALLNFLLPDVFSSAEKFDDWFQIDTEDQKQDVVKQLHRLLRPFLLRRLKVEVEKSLPPKRETILKVGMSEMQRKWYTQVMQKDLDVINGSGERSRLLNIVMQLRKCCNHPYLFQGAEPGPPFTTDMHLIENSGKMVLLDKLLPKLKARDSRVLIFSQMTRLLDILEDYCLFRGYKYCRIDGSTDGVVRQEAIDAYNSEGSEKFIFLLSTRAGGLGINLATADTVVLYDSDWNPQVDLQAMDRAHRIGQKKEVQVFRFCSESTIEEKVIEKAYKKLKLDALVIQQGRLQGSKKAVTKDDLLEMVRSGADKIFQGTEGTITDEDIDAIIKKGTEATRELNDKMATFTEDAMKFSLDGGDIYEYGDKDGDGEGQPDLKKFIADNWIGPGPRERRRKMVGGYNENDYFRDKLNQPKGPAGPKMPRLPKMPNMHEFQFFNVGRITDLYEKESRYEHHRHQQQQKAAAAEAQGASTDSIAKILESGPGDAQPLTEAETEEREALLEEGFSNWTKRDFNAFIRACEQSGRTEMASIAEAIEGKTEAEVRAYSEVFWERYSELDDHERFIRQVERGEQRLQRQQELMDNIGQKVGRYKNPWREMRFVYGTAKGKAYTEEEDRFLLCMVHKLGYGAWDEIKSEIRKSWLFRFDWFFKSRTPPELQRRCDTLIRLVERENEELSEQAAKEKKARKSASGRSGGSRGSGGSASKRQRV